jgi:hypothetical protein
MSGLSYIEKLLYIEKLQEEYRAYSFQKKFPTIILLKKRLASDCQKNSVD